MGRSKLYTGILVGAIVGGLTALMNKETRWYVKGKVTKATTCTKYYLSHPSEAVRNVRVSFDDFNENFKSSAESAINALEQIEDTLDKVTKKNSEQKKID